MPELLLQALQLAGPVLTWSAILIGSVILACILDEAWFGTGEDDGDELADDVRAAALLQCSHHLTENKR